MDDIVAEMLEAPGEFDPIWICHGDD